MPALLVALDMVEEGDTVGGAIPFGKFEERFRTLMRQVRPSASEKAWEPFFHLSSTSRVWKLAMGHQPVAFDDVPGGRPKSRWRLVNRADRAVFVEQLVPALQDPADRDAVRQAIYDLLRSDESEEPEALARTHAST